MILILSRIFFYLVPLFFENIIILLYRDLKFPRGIIYMKSQVLPVVFDKYLIVQNLAGQNFSRTKFLIGHNFSHPVKIWSLLSY